MEVFKTPRNAPSSPNGSSITTPTSATFSTRIRTSLSSAPGFVADPPDSPASTPLRTLRSRLYPSPDRGRCGGPEQAHRRRPGPHLAARQYLYHPGHHGRRRHRLHGLLPILPNTSFEEALAASKLDPCFIPFTCPDFDLPEDEMM